MFIHLYKYRIKALLGAKVIMFWSLVFPVLLGTLFYLGFGTSSDIYENFKAIPIAVCSEVDSSENMMFAATVEEVEFSERNPMFKVMTGTREECEQLLNDGKVDGYILLGDEIKFFVTASDMNQSIIKQFIETYKKTAAIYNDVATYNPACITEIMSIMQSENSYLRDVAVGGEQVDANVQFFYALIAMACMYGSFVGMQNMEDVQANATPLGARRVCTPTHHMKLIVADMLAGFTLHFVELLISWLYLWKVLGMPLGDQPLLFMLVCFFGTLIGVTLGEFIGAVSRGSSNAKVALSLSISMISSFLAGLMNSQMKYIVEQNVPFINRINPAALITDAFYCLSVYSDYERFTTNMITLATMAVILITGTFLAVRRTKYVSI